MGTYVEIPEKEMRTLFHKWEENTETRGELCFDHPIKNGIVIKCMTSVLDGIARSKGQDAIRLFAVDTVREKGYIKTRRVYRTTNWKDNIIKAYKDIYEQTKTRMIKEGKL